MKEDNTFVFDIETERPPGEVEGGWANPEGMGFGLAVGLRGVRLNKNSRALFYLPIGINILKAQISDSTTIVTFNGVRFDYRVLYGNNYTIDQVSFTGTHVDLLLEVVRGKYGVKSVLEAEEKYGPEEVHDGSIGLDGIGEGTLGMHKTGHGAKAPEMLAAGRVLEVVEYCMNDVLITARLYQFALENGYLVDRHGIKIQVNLSDKFLYAHASKALEYERAAQVDAEREAT